MIVLAAAALVNLLVTGFVHVFVRSYTRIQGVQKHSVTLWVVARPVGVVVAAATWTALKLGWTTVLNSPLPDAATSITSNPSLLDIAANFGFSLVLVAVFDLLVTKFLFDEPSYAESREYFIEYGDSNSSGQDWIDALYSSGDGLE